MKGKDGRKGRKGENKSKKERGGAAGFFWTVRVAFLIDVKAVRARFDTTVLSTPANETVCV